ncbi:S-adenosyl-L-methionine-dependent methyltransferase, partial [Mycena polygramma]
MQSKSIQTLKALSKIIVNAVDTMELAYADAEVDFPSLEDPFEAAGPGEAMRQDSLVSGAVQNLMAAAAQIVATVANPVTAILNASQAFHVSSCLRVASELNVVEILREAGPRGLHINEIASYSKVDYALLARMLRLLATHHIFREVSPNVFANNRLSSALDKQKSPSALFASPEDRLSGTSGVAALAEFFTEDCFRSSCCLLDTTLSPQESIVPYNRAFGTTEPFYLWIQRPENASRLKRFGLGMQGTAVSEGQDTIFQGFDWSTLKEGSVIVDVGGGIGHLSLSIAKRFPKLRFVVQDLQHQVDEAKDHWSSNFVEHVEGGMVEFQGHDFFTPQPVKNADVFLLRYIAHNWPAAKLIPILRHLRDAALLTTQLVIVEKILPVAARDQGAEVNGIPGAARPVAQAPLLSNWGIATVELYFFDLGIHTMLGGTERTLDGYTDVLQKAGWELVRV